MRAESLWGKMGVMLWGCDGAICRQPPAASSQQPAVGLRKRKNKSEKQKPLTPVTGDELNPMQIYGKAAYSLFSSQTLPQLYVI